VQCSKCHTENSDNQRFCRRCHATLLFTCPACKASQRHGGKCDQCGVDLTKYAMMLAANERTRTDLKREQKRERVAAWKQVALLPITGGFSLIRYLLRRRA
jgi:zinc-ribbon domain